MRVCSACARTTDETGRFCPECGAALRDVSPGQAPTERLPAAGPVAETDPAPSATSSSATRLLGKIVDSQFRIDAILGGGAFGTVYRGTQLGLDRPVAVKVPNHEVATDPVMAKRFKREARSAARVAHPGVVAIYAVGELFDGRPYLAMQLVDGEPLDKVLADGPLEPVRALRITRAIASALAETHAVDVVHRDLKPTNVMWRRDRAGDDRITIVDFGIAVCKPGTADATRLTSGGLIGTPHYMSPEQAHGEEVDARADLYALGCLLFELVTSTTPVEGSGFEVLLAHLGRPAPRPSERVASVPDVIDRVCGALMQKKRDDRPQHADEVVAMIDDALAQLEGRPLPATQPKRATALRQRPRTVATRYDLPEGTLAPRGRRTRRWIAAGVVTVLALGGAGFAILELRDKTTPASAAENTDNDPSVGRRRAVVKDNGEMLVQLMIPDPLLSGYENRFRLEIKNKLGQPVVADEVVLTIADESGSAKGLTARARGKTKGRYYFGHTFANAGSYTLRVFPPSVDSSFEIPIDVR